jgi:hypothetical protein
LRHIPRDVTITSAAPFVCSTTMADSDYPSRLEDILRRFKAFRIRHGDSDDERQMSEEFLAVLRDACSLIRDAELSDASEAISAKVQAFFDESITYAYGEGDLFDFMPSFAHSSEYPEVKDKAEGKIGGLRE